MKKDGTGVMSEQQIQPNKQNNNPKFKPVFSADLMNMESNSTNDMITIENNSLTNIILNVIGDPQKLSILKTMVKNPMTISEVLDKCSISNTSGYRKCNSLIQSGLLVKNDFIVTSDGRKIIRYKSLFENFQIDIQQNNVKVKAQFASLDK